MMSDDHGGATAGAALRGIRRKDPEAAAAALRIVADAVSKGQPVPIVLREWFAGAVHETLRAGSINRAKALGNALGLHKPPRLKPENNDWQVIAEWSFSEQRKFEAKKKIGAVDKALQAAAGKFSCSIDKVKKARTRLRKYLTEMSAE